MRTRLCLLGVAGLMIAAVAPVAVSDMSAAQVCDRAVLMVAGQSPAPSGDASLATAVEAASPGCVTVIADDVVTVADALAFDVVVITSSVNPGVLGDRLADAAVPILVSESYLFDDMGFVESGKGKDYDGDSTIRVTDPGHPLAGGYTFDVPVYTGVDAVGIAFDSAAPGLIPVAATSPGSPRLTLFGFETGSELVAGTVRAGRVGFFATYGARLTSQGADLVHAAIDWLLTQPGDLDPDRDAVSSGVDVCPFSFDILQFDTDGDGDGDACDPTPVIGSSGLFSNGGETDWPTASERLQTGLADLDDDGDLDSIVATLGDVAVLLNDGTGALVRHQKLELATGNIHFALGDVDRDSDLDIFFGRDGPARVYLNDGDGTFADTGQSLGTDEATDAALGDVDGDGDLDAFLTSQFGANRVWLNDGNGVFTVSGQTLGFDFDVELGDLDDDGDLDAFIGQVAAPGVDAPNRVLFNDGNGVYSDSGQVLGTEATLHVALGDVDRDGDLDAFVANTTADRVWLNDGDGSFTDSGQTLGGDRSTHVALGDIDGDGDLDAFTTGLNKMWLNDGTGYFADSGQALDFGSAFRSDGLALGDIDGDGDLDAHLVTSFEPDRVLLNDTAQQPRAIMIAGNTNPPSGDRMIRDSVLAAGFDLSIVDDNSNLESLNLTGTDLLLISTSVVPSNVGDTFKDVPVPVIIWEGYLFDDMALSNSGETSQVHTDVTIVNPGHPLAAGLDAKAHTVYEVPERLSFGRPGSHADVVAHAPGRPLEAVLFAYSTGDLLLDGSAAAGPRIALFPNYDGAKRLTPIAEALLDAALAWPDNPAPNSLVHL